jgi:hypothetical protein
MTQPETSTMLRIMPREMRMMTERVFSLTGLPKGFYLAAPDLVMYSQKLGLGGFALLEQRFADLVGADPLQIAVAEEKRESLRLDAGGQHAWFVVPVLIDLLGELAGRYGTARISVVGAIDPQELQIAVALGRRSGLAVHFAGGAESSFAASPEPLTGDLSCDEPLLRDLLVNGTPIEADLWWRIYHLAQKALTPDSVVSRRHAGPLIVNDDGTVIGRKDNDDETDISFLTVVKGGFETEGAQS